MTDTSTERSFPEDIVIADTVRWLEKAVIGLNLCPFAKAVYVKERIRYVVSAAGTPEALLAVDHDDRVVGATRAARRLLSIDDDLLAEAPNVDDLVNATEGARGDVLAEAERRTIVRALSRAGGNLSAAARLIGISRSTLYRKLASYDIDNTIGAAKPRPSS